jgi:hypothetical protein
VPFKINAGKVTVGQTHLAGPGIDNDLKLLLGFVQLSLNFARRLVLLHAKQVPLPFNPADFYHYELEGNKLTWELGLQLIKAVKLFTTSSSVD